MLRSIKDLKSHKIEARDGSVGKVKDALFDEEQWRMRYMVADTGNWLARHKVLLCPAHFNPLPSGESEKTLNVGLTKEQIENAPELDNDAPVSRRYEHLYAQYHSHDPYWDYPSSLALEGATAHAIAVPREQTIAEEKEREKTLDDIEKCHLRSATEIIGYEIDAEDESFGCVDDFIIEDTSWEFKYLVIDTRKWLPGKKLLVSLEWIKYFDWPQKKAAVSLTRELIEHAPTYDPEEPVNRDYLNNLYDYYGKPRKESELKLATR